MLERTVEYWAAVRELSEKLNAVNDEISQTAVIELDLDDPGQFSDDVDAAALMLAMR